MQPLCPARDLPEPNQYVKRFYNEYSSWCMDEVEAPNLKGLWRKKAFNTAEDFPLDLEIGTGSGFFFADYAQKNPTRSIIGLEIKFKVLIQTVKRTLAQKCQNFKMLRFRAEELDKIFAPSELNHIFIYFPDPWPKRKHEKHRLIQDRFFEMTYELQKDGSFLEFKTDDKNYFQWTVEKAKKSKYKVSRFTEDLHNSQWAQESFRTQFEKLWTSKGLKTNLIRLEK